MKRFSAFNLVSVMLGFAFLYLPILLLVIYSFNDSQLVTVWGGFSTQVVRGAACRTRRSSTPPG